MSELIKVAQTDQLDSGGLTILQVWRRRYVPIFAGRNASCFLTCRPMCLRKSCGP